MTPLMRHILPVATLCAIVAAGPAGCAHGRRMTEIRTFETGYFQLLQRADYDLAYESLHPDIKVLLPLDRYRTFFTVLTDTLGPMKSWRQLPNAQDHVPLLERERRRDPLPPDQPKRMLETSYRLQFEKGQTTLVIRTGWDKERMVIRGQFLCCADAPTIAALQALAQERGVGDLFGVKPPPQTTPRKAPAGGPDPNSP
ncbi:MAG: hypothetical protein HY208_01515 [Nitrospirae bacterium]|nr:hypothetical protein [Nitrospirota bacterium]